MIGSTRTMGEEVTAVAGARSGINAALAIVLGALLLTIVLYWPTSREIADLWQDTVRRRYTHGWLMLAVTVWLLWRDRAAYANTALAPPRGGWLLTAALSVAWLVGFNGGVLALTTLVMPLLVLAAILAAGGFRVARLAAFPLLYLYFAFPIWEVVNPLLQTLTAHVNLWLTRLAGIPVVMQEYVIQIPSGSFEISGGCSGLHFFIVALAIAALQGELDRDDLRSRCLLLGIAGGVALVTNWIRVFVIIVAGHWTDMQHFLVRVDPYYFGWILFVFALGFYLYLAARVPRRHRAPPAQISVTPAATGKRAVAAAVFPAVALALGPAWAISRNGGSEATNTRPPPSIDGWAGPSLYLSDWSPAFANPDEEFLVAYDSESAGDVALYKATYRSQRQGKELRGHGNSVVGARRQSLESHRREILLQGTAVTISEQVAESVDGRALVVWSLFAVDGKPDSMNLQGRLAYGLRALFEAPEASVVALAAECRPDCDRARSALQAAAVHLLPAVLTPRPPKEPAATVQGVE